MSIYLFGYYYIWLAIIRIYLVPFTNERINVEKTSADASHAAGVTDPGQGGMQGL